MIILKEKVLLFPKIKIQVKKTLDNVAEYNILENYNYNLNLLREFIEKQAQVYYISITLFNFLTDLNYSVVRFWLVIME